MIVQDIINELNQFMPYINEEQIQDMAQALVDKKPRIFLAGAGRSGCVVRAFTNRLMHLGFTCYLLGDITTPPIKEGDVLFILSGSGKTTSLVNYASQAKNYGAEIYTMTMQPEGTIGKMAAKLVVLPGTTRLQDEARFKSFQPVGSSFEQLSWLTCDGLVCLLKDKLHLTNEDLIAHHANLE